MARVFSQDLARNSGSYFGVTSQNPDFARIRGLPPGERRSAFSALRERADPFVDLPPPARSAAEVEQQMSDWERGHPEFLQLMRDDGRFFGFTNVANGALQRSTSFVFIPAVRDVVADAQDAKGAVIARLLELVVKSAIQRRRDFREWKERISAEYRDITSPDALPELRTLASELTGTLRAYYSEAGVGMDWSAQAELPVPLPTAEVKLDEGGFTGPVNRKGHGLQRAFALTLLQHLAKAAATNLDDEDEVVLEQAALPGLILAIEEPELYQHPTKQRHFAKVLAELSSGTLPGVASTSQVLFASHSPLFISLDRFEEIRLARRRVVGEHACKECTFNLSTLQALLPGWSGRIESIPELSRLKD